MALMMSLPVRIPESNRTVSFPLVCASMIFGEAQILSSAHIAGIEPSICRPPSDMTVRFTMRIIQQDNELAYRDSKQ